MKIVKKYWYIILLAVVLVVVAILYFTNDRQPEDSEQTDQTNQNNENRELLTYVEDYFNKYVNVLGINEYNVTIQMLKDAVNLELAHYNMVELEKCENDSYATVTLKTYETTIEKIDSHFICK